MAKKAERKTPEMHPLTKLTNAWRQACRDVEALTGEFNDYVAKARGVEEKITEARKRQKTTWDEMAAYKVGSQMLATPPPLEQEQASDG